MTGLFTAPSHLRPEAVRPALTDSNLSDVFSQFEAEFVVDWQVAEASDRPEPAINSGD